MTARTITPTAAEIADAIIMAEMGGDLRDLAAGCAAMAKQSRGAARERLVRASASLSFAADLHDAYVAQKAEEARKRDGR